MPKVKKGALSMELPLAQAKPYPLEHYLVELARYLPLGTDEKATIVGKVRTHLEERVAHAMEGGLDRLAAEERAVAAFVAPRAFARQLSGTHPVLGRVRDIVGAGFLGGIVVWVLWTATAYLLMVNSDLWHLAYRSSGPDGISSLLHLLALSTPLSTESAIAFFGKQWLLPVVLLYLVMPLIWGLRAQRWWLPGLAYGLGAVLLNPVAYGVFFPSLSEAMLFLPLSMLALSGLPLAVLASYLGYSCRISSKEKRTPTGIPMPSTTVL